MAQLIDVVEVRWYTEAGTEPADLAVSYLALARQLLPDALPRRFGVFEPLDASLDAEDDAAFVAARDGADTAFFTDTFPCFAGSLGASRPPFADGPVRGHTLTVDRTALGDPVRRRALQAFFVRFALSGKAFFATAGVQRGVHWDGRALEFGTEAEPLPYVLAPPRPGQRTPGSAHPPPQIADRPLVGEADAVRDVADRDLRPERAARDVDLLDVVAVRVDRPGAGAVVGEPHRVGT